MKNISAHFLMTPWFIFAAAWLCVATCPAETNLVHMAVVPFHAPAGNSKLQNAAQALPDLLTAALSSNSRFQLVEREKINAVWGELHLTEAGLTSADTVAKLGKVLSCDWLVSGSLLPVGTNAQIWVKVIDTQNGVLLDMKALPYDAATFQATAAEIARFLEQAKVRTQPREFIALEKFEDRSVSSTREDWTPRLRALIEKYLLDAGYGVAERDSVAPIFAEYQLQSAGMTADARQVKLKPIFWTVGGSWKWFRDTQDKLSVTINLRKMGGREQMLSFTKPPGEDLEKAVVDAIQSTLKSTGSVTVEQALAAEQKLRSAHLDELSKGRGETYTPSRFKTETPPVSITVTDAYGGKSLATMDPAFQAQQQSHVQEMTKTMQQAILLNPTGAKAKFMQGMALYGVSDAGQSRQGEKLLEEVAKSGDPAYATKAKNWLSDVRTGKLTFEHDRFGNLEIVQHGQPASFPPVDTNLLAKHTKELSAKVAKMNEVTNIVARAVPLATFPGNQLSSPHFDGLTAAKLWQKKILVACGPKLQVFDIESRSLTDFNLPLRMKSAITAIEADKENLWLGTEGGLVRVALVGGQFREFGEKDGLPMTGISALRLAAGKLFIGFGAGRNGAFGWLDLPAEKFTGLMAAASVRKSWPEAVQSPPEVPVSSITTLDGNDFWVSTQIGLQRLDLAAKKWSLGTPVELAGIRGIGENGLAANSKYIAALLPGRCVAIFNRAGQRWSCINLSADLMQNSATAVAFDPSGTDLLWVGSERGCLSLINLSIAKVVAAGQVSSPGGVEKIFPAAGYIVFIARGHGESDLYRLERSQIFGTTVAATPAAASENSGGPFMLQRNFSKFMPVTFKKGAGGFAAIQTLNAKLDRILVDGKYYHGFSFTVPAWLDGNLQWTYLLAKTEAQKDFRSQGLGCGIVSPSGPVMNAPIGERGRTTEYAALQRQFPFTGTVITETVPRPQLQPGKTYAVWFYSEDEDLPDIAFALSVNSKRGQEEFGKLPTTAAVPVSSAANPALISTKPFRSESASGQIPMPPPTSAEQLRGEIEAAIKTKNADALTRLFCWQDVPKELKTQNIEVGISSWLNLENPKVTLIGLEPMETLTNVVNGYIHRPNINVLGYIKITTDQWGNANSFPYGKFGDAYYVATWLKEPVKN